MGERARETEGVHTYSTLFISDNTVSPGCEVRVETTPASTCIHTCARVYTQRGSERERERERGREGGRERERERACACA